MSRGAQPSARDKSGRTPAHYAAAHGHEEVLQYLSAKGAELDAEDPAGRAPLHHAALAGGRAGVAASAQDNGSPIDAGSPAETGVAGTALGALGFLARCSAWVDAPDGDDNTPLHLAARCAPRLPLIMVQCI